MNLYEKNIYANINVTIYCFTLYFFLSAIKQGFDIEFSCEFFEGMM